MNIAFNIRVLNSRVSTILTNISYSFQKDILTANLIVLPYFPTL